LPGLTANVRIVVDERPDALKVANAALRFRPAGASEGGALDAAPAPSGAALAASRAGSGGNQQGAAAGNERLTQLTALLDLSADQQSQVKSLMAGSRERVRAARQGGEGDSPMGGQAGDGRAMAQQARAQFESALTAILTPVQFEKYKVVREARNGGGTRRGRVWIDDGNGGAKPVDLILGITDGATTEVVSGDLDEGESVIVGNANPTTARPTSRGLPGFGR
jgi:HlyD family secretion protein